MSSRSHLSTVRLAPEEKKRVEKYLKENPIFESFSSLARVATLTFMGQGNQFHLSPLREESAGKRPRFFWDYDISETQLREILRSPGFSPQKRWVTERILAEARFDEVMRYLGLDEIERALPELRLPQKKRERWEYALKRWNRQS